METRLAEFSIFGGKEMIYSLALSKDNSLLVSGGVAKINV